MAEKIEVYYTKVPGPLPAWHKTLVYTKNDGSQLAIRGGPFTDPYTGRDYLFVENSYPFIPGTSDFPEKGEEYYVELVVTKDDLSREWWQLDSRAIEWSKEKYDYAGTGIGGPNSNTLIDDLIHSTGLSIPDSELWAPGSMPGEIPPKWITQPIPDFPSRFEDDFEDAENTSSPLVLDLNGDGVSTTSIGKGSGVYFDHDGNGFAGSSAWVAKGDGLLVLDRDGNGVIDDGSELFGSNTKLKDGSFASNGFQALAQYDENKDGVIDQNDYVFSSMGVWIDSNQDGVSQDGELFSLADLGILGINLGYTNSKFVDANGNEHKQEGSFIWSDGSIGAVNDVWFQVNKTDSKDKVTVDIPEELYTLPDMQAFGNVHRLRKAMALDGSGKLKSLVENYCNEADETKRLALVDEIIFAWTKSDAYATNSRGSYIDGRKLYALEAFNGEGYLQVGHRSNPDTAGAAKLNQIFNELKQYVNATLMLKSHLLPYITAIGLSEDGYDLSKMVELIKVDFSQNADKGMGVVRSIINAITYGQMSHVGINGALAYHFYTLGKKDGDIIDKMIYHMGKTLTIGGEGIDKFYGGSGKDYLFGGAGNDHLEGGAGDDWLEGGAGNDWLQGGGGDDTYYFEQGWGQDTVYAYNHYAIRDGEMDRILFGRGITASDLSFTRGTGSYGSNNLLIQYKGSSDLITVRDYFYGEGGTDQCNLNVEFADGTIFDLNTIKAMMLVPTDGNDLILGYGESEVLRGGLGNDEIYGNGGNDTLYGDEGDDKLEGSSGDDILYGGIGNDKLYGGADNDKLYGGEGNDTLEGGAGDDWLEGGAGNDWLQGGGGDDTYYFEQGWGQDTVYAYNHYAIRDGEMDRILFGRGITASDLSFTRGTGSYGSNNLLIQYKGSSDLITVRDYFYGEGGTDQCNLNVEFADGTIFDLNTIKAMMLVPTDGNDLILGYGESEVLRGGLGNDEIYGNGGNDTLYGDEGDDKLEGSSGDDILYGGIGNDKLYGGADNDKLYGGEGNDTLEGGAGDDWLEGGAGNDWLQGGGGDDTYYFEQGWGQDTVYAYNHYAIRDGEMDRILFGRGITASDLSFTRGTGSYGSNNLLIQYKGSSDLITVRDYFYGEGGTDQCNLNVEFADGTIFDLNTIKAMMLVPTDGNDLILGYGESEVLRGGLGNDEIYGNGGNDTLYGDEGDDKLEGSSGDDILYGGIGNDKLYGGADNDKLYGGEGNDTLEGGAGDDWLEGGAGNDWLQGGGGDDTYYFEQGWGQDTVYAYNHYAIRDGEMDRILFGRGITASDLSFTRGTGSYGSNNLLIQYKGSSDLITVRDYFYGEGGTDQCNLNVEFADGTIFDLNTIKAMMLVPTDGNDLILGYGESEVLRGGLGNDEIYGNGGNDTLYGDEGDDKLEGSSGDDILYGGIGNDKLYGGADNDKLYGGEGNDTLEGGAGDDWLEGGAGNDWLQGGGGDDTYYFEQGWGQDTVYAYNHYAIRDGEMDRILFGRGITASDLSFTRGTGSYGSNNLLIQYKGSSDLITVRDYFYGEGGTDQCNLNVEFADGTIFDLNTIKAMMLVPTDGNDLILGYGESEVLRGGLGNDEIYGNGGNDTLYGDEGDDKLYGGDGDDELYGGAGNDSLNGGVGNDLLYGGAGDDSLVGGDGDDYIEGGIGNDYLYGGNGSDVYYFEKGWGSDFIDNYYGTTSSQADKDRDVIRFGEGISAADIKVSRVGDRLVLEHKGTGDRIEDRYYFEGAGLRNWTIHEIQFADGTVWSIEDVKGMVNPTRMFSAGTASTKPMATVMQIDSLVSAMASFAPLAAAESHLNVNAHSFAVPLLAVNG